MGSAIDFGGVAELNRKRGDDMTERFLAFFADENGAVTVDWVALVATLVLMGIGLGVTINTQTDSVADAISDEIGSMSVWTF